MKDLEHAFNIRRESHESLSDFVCFLRAVRDVKPNTRTLLAGFNRLVDKSDYLPSEKTELLRFVKNYAK